MRTFFSNVSLGILAAIFSVGVLLIAVSFLMYGVATGLGTVFTAQPWLGWVITGGGFLLVPSVYLGVHYFKPKKAPSDLTKMSIALIQKVIDGSKDIDVRGWTRAHPYQSTGAAAAAGFIAAGKNTSDIMDALKEVLLPVLVEHLQDRQK